MHRSNPLWSADDQVARLAELLGGDIETKTLPLRHDVRSLGTLLGQVIREQEGDALFDAVESLRQLAIRHREHDLGDAITGPADADTALMRDAERIVDALHVRDAYKLTKAFAIYFELTNLAETAHRKRRRRALQLDSQGPAQRGTMLDTLLRMQAAGVDMDAALEQLRRVMVVPVFTAHPTEVSRRTVLFKRRRIAEALERLDTLPLTDAAAAAEEEKIVVEITSLWQTDEVRRRRPSVTDEVRMGLDYYADVLIDTVPGVYAELALAFSECYGRAMEPAAVPGVVRFGSWIGGDADGNPYVTPEVTRVALQLARETILDHYVRALESLVERLSMSTEQVPVSRELEARLRQYASMTPSLDPRPESRADTEPYRHFLGYVGWRLRAARDEPGGARGYSDAESFAEDLRCMGTSLAQNRGTRVAALLVDPLLDRKSVV